MKKTFVPMCLALAFAAISTPALAAPRSVDLGAGLESSHECANCSPLQYSLNASISSDVAAAAPVPEPASLLLFGTGMIAAGMLYRRRNRVQ